MKVINRAGTAIDFDAAVMYMDEDVRESVRAALVPCTEQEFFTAYEKLHEIVFDDFWELSRVNPTW